MKDSRFEEAIANIVKQEPIKMSDKFCFSDQKFALRDEWNDVMMDFEVSEDKFIFNMGANAIIADGDNLKKFIKVMKMSIQFYKDMEVTN